jgi:hypothetical protein
MKKIAYTLLALTAFSQTAFADQSKYTGGMKYTTMQPTQQSNSDKKPLYNRTASETDSQTEEELPQEEKPAEQTVWDRYKELASGKAKETETQEGSALPKAPEKPTLPQKQATPKEPQNATGMAGLIQEYKRNKAKRSQMRSISFSKPETPTVEKPKTEKPE